MSVTVLLIVQPLEKNSKRDLNITSMMASCLAFSGADLRQCESLVKLIIRCGFVYLQGGQGRIYTWKLSLFSSY